MGGIIATRTVGGATAGRIAATFGTKVTVGGTVGGGKGTLAGFKVAVTVGVGGGGNHLPRNHHPK